jgi:hypothetical protein
LKPAFLDRHAVLRLYSKEDDRAAPNSVSEILERMASDQVFARLIEADPRRALEAFNLTPFEVSQIEQTMFSPIAFPRNSLDRTPAPESVTEISPCRPSETQARIRTIPATGSTSTIAPSGMSSAP